MANHKHLIVEPNIDEPDLFYESLIDAHQGLNDTQSLKLNVLMIEGLKRLLDNPVILEEALSFAARGSDAPAVTDARLILLLANHVGNVVTLRAAFAAARAELL